MEATELTHTVQITRKISDGNYGSTEYGIFSQFNGDFEAGVAEAFDKARAALDEQVAATPEVDVAVQQVAEAFPGAQVVPQDEPAATGLVSANPPFPADTKDRDEKRKNQAWAVELFQRDPGSFYDNRPQKASGERGARYPDIKHKNSGVAAWFD